MLRLHLLFRHVIYGLSIPNLKPYCEALKGSVCDLAARFHCLKGGGGGGRSLSLVFQLFNRASGKSLEIVPIHHEHDHSHPRTPIRAALNPQPLTSLNHIVLPKPKPYALNPDPWPLNPSKLSRCFISVTSITEGPAEATPRAFQRRGWLGAAIGPM